MPIDTNSTPSTPLPLQKLAAGKLQTSSQPSASQALTRQLQQNLQDNNTKPVQLKVESVERFIASKELSSTLFGSDKPTHTLTLKTDASNSGATQALVLRLAVDRLPLSQQLIEASLNAKQELQIRFVSEQKLAAGQEVLLTRLLNTQASSTPHSHVVTRLQQLAAQEPKNAVLQKLVKEMINSLPSPQKLSTSAGVNQQLKLSGSHLENQLSQARTQGPEALKDLPHDLKANLLRLFSHLFNNSPEPKGTLQSALQRWLAPPQSMPRQQGGYSTATAFEFPTALHPLKGELNQGAGAVARQAESLTQASLLQQLGQSLRQIQAQQAHSLAPVLSNESTAPSNSWLYELPIRNQEQVDNLQLRIDEYSEDEQAEALRKGKRWQVNLSFDIAPLGPFHALLSLTQGKVDLCIWADHPPTLRLLNKELAELRKNLEASGLEVEQLHCKRGIPPRPQTLIQQQLVDIHT